MLYVRHTTAGGEKLGACWILRRAGRGRTGGQGGLRGLRGLKSPPKALEGGLNPPCTIPRYQN